jgi:CRISPR-associated endonuclease/helicase Cas3
VPKGYPLHANTRRDTGAFNQTLDEHCWAWRSTLAPSTTPCRVSSVICPGWPGTGADPRSQEARFRWQDKATDVAATMRERSAGQGAFIINMASTGCGKTLANARIMNALADPLKGMRCAFALGLRTLTCRRAGHFAMPWPVRRRARHQGGRNRQPGAV